MQNAESNTDMCASSSFVNCGTAHILYGRDFAIKSLEIRRRRTSSGF
ncbi:hypothetical protein KP509_32G060800 [Ceratopteris richardii]|uniref:Uncharacterized protein n=1 Tax=Ceratopteris richardii TaxID=49495 RepID=A0A8T2QU97_CERRI|nr:hypothetical protein KP509_32G060800 [Ceratopteris richardii]